MRPPWIAVFCLLLALLCGPALAQAPGANLEAWIARLHHGAQQNSYSGVLVMNAGSRVQSARVLHIFDAGQQIERVDALTGTPQITVRRNAQVLTLYPLSRVGVSEPWPSGATFPQWPDAMDAAVGNWYGVRQLGFGRVLGMDAEVVELLPKDNLRFAYRVWAEAQSGLALQLQTLDSRGRVLEQSSFINVQLLPRLRMREVELMLPSIAAYQIQPAKPRSPLLDNKTWVFQTIPQGFRAQGAYVLESPAGTNASDEPNVQWMFSDGLAKVSVFAQAMTEGMRMREGLQALGGATFSATRRMGSWAITAVGEAPPPTLQGFVQALARVK